MPYEELAVADIEPNPFQIRTGVNPAVVGIATTAALNPKLGILQAPLVRPHGRKYQISFGHGRLEAAKLNGYEKIWCRVEELTDADMKKNVLVENVNRQDLSHEELIAGLEQYREDLGLDKDASGFYVELSKQTGITKFIISSHYLVEEMYQYIQKVADISHFKPGIRAVMNVSRLPKNVAYAVLVKADDMAWGQRAVQVVADAMETLSKEVAQYLIHDKRTKTPHTVIEAISTLPKEQQMEVAKRIKTRRYNEEDSIAFVERVKRGEHVQDITVEDEYTETLNNMRDTMIRIKTWGLPQYAILGDEGWSKASDMFTTTEEHLGHLKLKEWDKL